MMELPEIRFDLGSIRKSRPRFRSQETVEILDAVDENVNCRGGFVFLLLIRKLTSFFFAFICPSLLPVDTTA